MARAAGARADAEPGRGVAVLDGALPRARRGRHAPARRQLPRAPRRAGRGPWATPGCGSCSLLGDEERVSRSTSTRRLRSTSSEWVLWHDGNPNAVVNCVTLARENARSVREQISGEMWEAINKLFLLVRGANRRAVSRGPHTFFEQLRNGASPLPGRGGRDDDPRRPVRVHPPRAPARARREDGADRRARDTRSAVALERGRSRARAGS